MNTIKMGEFHLFQEYEMANNFTIDHLPAYTMRIDPIAFELYR